jgi:glucokinase
MLRAGFPGVPVRIENDVKSAAFAELRKGALRDVETGIYLNLGTGIAAALIIGGRIVRGSHGAAGEIGFNPRSPADTEGAPAGRVPLEEFVGGRSVEAMTGEGTGLAPGEAFARYRDDPIIRQRLDPLFNEIGYHLANLAIAIDPSRLAIGGGLMRSGEVILPAVEERIRRFLPFHPEVVAARFGADAALMGALELAVEEMPSI